MSRKTYLQFLETLAQYNIQSVADESGVHFTTLHCWLRHQHQPRMATLVKVLPVIGLELVFEKRRKTLRAVA